MLSEILGEIDSPSTSVAKPKIKEYSVLAKKLAAKNYMKNFSQPIKKRAIERKSLPTTETPENNSTPLKEVTANVEQPTKRILEPVHAKINQAASPVVENNEKFDETLSDQFTEDISFDDFNETPTKITETQIIDTEMTQEEFDDDFDVTLIEEVESKLSAAGEKLADNIQADFETEWENFSNTSVNVDSNNQNLLDKTDIPLEEVDGQKVNIVTIFDLPQNLIM